MPKSDPFTLALKADLKSHNITQQEAANKAKKSFKQFTRELRGETSQGMMTIETVAELKKEGVISEHTVDAWWQTKKQILRLKRKGPLKAAR